MAAKKKRLDRYARAELTQLARDTRCWVEKISDIPGAEGKVFKVSVMPTASIPVYPRQALDSGEKIQ